MTQDEIIEMARQAGFFIIANSPDLFPKLVAFAKLVAAKEREALAQEQEPVAWIHNFIDGGISIGKRPTDLNRHPDRWTALYKDPKPCPTCEALARTVMLDQTSHDTAPLQRTEQEPVAWEQFYPDIGKPQIALNAEVVRYVAPQRTCAGLTDEEIDTVTDAQWAKGVNKPIYAAHRAYARAIEAKLKEKNT